MKILVTGGAGFIGSHLVDSYLQNQHEVVIIDNLSTGDYSNLNPNAKFFSMDIRDPQIVTFMKEHKFDIVNHHAAQIDVRIAVDDPVFDADVNVAGTLNILEGAVASGVKHFIFASSGGAVYGEVPEKELPAPECFPINPLSPYGAAKHAIEHYLFLYHKLYNLQYSVLRYGNVYGERQAKKGEAGVVSIFARLLLNDQACTIFGNGDQLRDYVYIRDVVKANMIVSRISNNQWSHFNDPVYNIGTGRGYSVNLLFQIITKILNNDSKAIYAPERKGEIFQTYLDISKAEKALNWIPEFSFEHGLQNTVEWFKKNHSLPEKT